VLVLEAVPEVLDAGSLDPGPVHIERSSALGCHVHGVVETQWERQIPAIPGEGERLDMVRTVVFSVGERAPAGQVRHLGRGESELADVTRLRRRGQLPGAATLLNEQTGAWAAQWSTADVEVVGDEELTLAVRHALFQLTGAVADHGEAAVGARGLTGPAYAGHVFWDADVFVLPVMAATRPRAARAMLEYRIRRLHAARRAAAAAGREGARFPWESAFDGTDVTPDNGLDEHGAVVPILTGRLEEHITADVAWAAWQFASMTGSWALLDGSGRGLLVDTARYWASRIRLDGSGRGHIDGVIGPDEYHEHVDDNAFTNTMAAWNPRRASELVGRMPGPDGPLCTEREEAARWIELSDRLVTGYDQSVGRHHQFAGFDDLEPLLAADLGPVPMPADLVLGRERLMRSQIIKQADVVMLHHLVPEALPAGSRDADLDYYLRRTAHGSSLSPSIHAAVLARAGRLDQAVELLDMGRRVDLEDLTGTTSGGLHLAAMGGLWQAIVFGFAGVSSRGPDDRVLVVDPRLPDHWRELRIRMLWHGVRVRLICRNQAVYVGCSSPLSVMAGSGRVVSVDCPGRWVDIDRTGGAP
jgi:trehalose/maltose hydrolase-like predicted phosphorylase